MYSQYKETPLCNLALQSLNVSDNSTLPYNTFIGEVTPDEIKALHGAKYNLQEQIDALSSQLKLLTDGTSHLNHVEGDKLDG